MAIGTFFAVAMGANVLACGSSGTSSSSTTSTSSTTSGSGGAGGSTSSAGGGGAGGMATTTSTTSTTTSTTGTGGSNPCPGLGDSCSNCTADKCMATYCACYADPSCGGLVQCNSACAPADTGCQKGCLAANPNAIAEAFVLGDCAATQCGGECPGTAPLGDCQRCLFTSCAAQMNDCLGNADCFDLLQCVQKCSPGDSGCQQACGFQHFDSIGKAQNIQDCSSAQCAGKCM